MFYDIINFMLQINANIFSQINMKIFYALMLLQAFSMCTPIIIMIRLNRCNFFGDFIMLIQKIWY